MTYCFRCPECGRVVEKTDREDVYCACRKMPNPTLMLRDYRAESAGVDLRGLRPEDSERVPAGRGRPRAPR